MWGARLAPPSFVVAFVGVVLLAFYLLYPSANLSRKLLAQTAPDKLAKRYLQHFLYYKPARGDYKLRLIEQEISLGHLENAFRLMKPLLKDKPATKMEWQILYWYSVYLRYKVYSYEYGTKPRQEYSAKLKRLLPELIKGQYNFSQLVAIADIALALEEGAIAKTAYGKIAAISPQYTAVDYTNLAKKALGSGNYFAAANFYFMAQKISKTISAKRRYFLAALQVMQSGVLLEEAVRAAELNIGELRNDQTTLVFVTKLALAAGKTKVAHEYIKKVVS